MTPGSMQGHQGMHPDAAGALAGDTNGAKLQMGEGPRGTLTIHPAAELDQPDIRAMARGERLNPTGLDWPNFMVTADEHGIVGAVQLRRHRDGSRELGTLVVRQQARGHGIAAKLIDALLAMESGRVHIITNDPFAGHYERWGFRRIPPRAAPAAVRMNYRIGRLAIVISLLRRRSIRRMVILEREGSAGNE